ncbi:uncharacterized protein LY79DRAFT_560876 [Colletotrichum navitas]|uniref:Uncharacterized protein n=1 Tax=Colletotrichum navitas TaxID=681940 RepID=A0AAD8PUY9_9PEZI|nr:uncharacterized protein LY79DRAFT_560876 [Colletotrichum navitas]KAK1580589.1 hypothetical protein LY79DRAFT_560876 [Colletotrichum navitas]
MAYSNDIYNRCPHQAFSWGVRYCCKDGKRPLSNCHWVGQGHCDDNICNPNEVTAARNSVGDGYGCRFGREKSLCCTPEMGTLEFNTCSASLCDYDKGLCDLDPWADGPDNDDDFSKQASRPSMNASGVIIRPRGYPGSSFLFDGIDGNQVLSRAFTISDPNCRVTKLKKIDPNTITKPEKQAKWATEHGVEIQYIKSFTSTAVTGNLPSKRRLTTTGYIGKKHMNEYFNNPNGLSTPYRATNTSRATRNPSAAMFEAIGSYTNRRSLFLVTRSLNSVKRRVFEGIDPLSKDRLQKFVAESIRTGKGEEKFLLFIRETIGTFQYIHDPEVLPRIQETRRRLRETSVEISTQIPMLIFFDEIWDEFDPDWWNTMTDTARGWVTKSIAYIEREYRAAAASPAPPSNWGAVQRAIYTLNRDMVYIKTLPRI